jgi:hypothetical protein
LTTLLLNFKKRFDGQEQKVISSMEMWFRSLYFFVGCVSYASAHATPTVCLTSTELIHSLFLMRDQVYDQFEIEKNKIHTYFNTFRSEFLPSRRAQQNSLSAEISKAVELANVYMSFESWESLGNEDEIEVWVNSNPLDNKIDEESEKWPIVKSRTIIDAPLDKLMDALLDSSKIHQLNENSLGRDDIQVVDKTLKIVWNKTKIPFSAAHDFCTVMHSRSNPFGTKDSKILVSKSVVHDYAPETENFTRSRILFGVNILTPCRENRQKTEFISISHIKYTGIHPYIVYKSAYQGVIGYTKKLKDLCSKTP